MPREWATKNNVDLQLTMVPWKEFMPKITAAIEARATPDIIESGGVELRGRGQLLEVTRRLQEAREDVRRLGRPPPKIMLEPDGRVHHILYGFSGPQLISRNDLLAQVGLTPPRDLG